MSYAIENADSLRQKYSKLIKPARKIEFPPLTPILSENRVEIPGNVGNLLAWRVRANQAHHPYRKTTQICYFFPPFYSLLSQISLSVSPWLSLSLSVGWLVGRAFAFSAFLGRYLHHWPCPIARDFSRGLFSSLHFHQLLSEWTTQLFIGNQSITTQLLIDN